MILYIDFKKLLICFFYIMISAQKNNFNATQSSGQNYTAPRQIPNMNDSSQNLVPPEFNEEMFIKMIENAVEQYESTSEEEKNAMCKEIGINREELDTLMTTAKEELEKIQQDTQSKPTFSKEEKTDTMKNTSIETKNEPIGEKKEIQKYINSIQLAIKTINKLHIKSHDETIQTELTAQYENILPKTEILNYYLGIILEFLKKYLDQNSLNIDKKKIKEIVAISDEINILEPTITRLITLQEYNETNETENMFKKYKIKEKTNKNLQEYLKREIQQLEEELLTLDSQDKIDKKIIKQQKMQIEYKIKLLEKDLTEALTTNIEKENKKNKSELDKFKESLTKSIEKITTQFEIIFEKQEALKTIEKFIKEYFPKEYNIGKEKEKLQKQQRDTEIKIKNQKGSSAETTIERNMPQTNYFEKKGKKEENDTFHFQERENDLDSSFDENESPFNLPKDEGQQNTRPEAKETKEETTPGNTKEESTDNNNKEFNTNNKRKKRTINAPENQRNTKTKQPNTKEKVSNSMQLLYTAVENATKTVISFTEENQTNTYNQEKSQLLINQLQEYIDIFTTTIKEFTKDETLLPETLKSYADKSVNPFEDIKKEETAKQWPIEIIKEDQKKIKIINEIKTKLKTRTIEIHIPLHNFQILFYKLEKLKEIFNTGFSKNIRNRTYQELLNAGLIETINEKMTELVCDIAKNNHIAELEEVKHTIHSNSYKKYNGEIPYWAYQIKELEKDLTSIIENESNPSAKKNNNKENNTKKSEETTNLPLDLDDYES